MRQGPGLAGRCLLAALAVLATPLPAICLEEAALATLNQLLETDPAAGFDKATTLFVDARTAADLDSIMALLDVVAPVSRSHACGRLLDDMVDTAAPMASAAGRWDALGSLYHARAWFAMSDNPNGNFNYSELMYLRAAHFVDLADEAWTRAGKPPDEIVKARERLRSVGSHVALESPGWGATGGPDWTQIAGAEEASQLAQVAEAFAEARDADCVDQVVTWLRGLNPDQTDQVRLNFITRRLVHILWMRGGERIMAALVDLADASGDRLWGQQWFVDTLGFGCAIGWSGRADGFEETYHQCLDRLEPGRDLVGHGLIHFLWRLRQWGRNDDAEQLVRRFVTIAQAAPPDTHGTAVGASILWPGAPEDLRRTLLELTIATDIANDDAAALCREADRVVSYGTPDERSRLALDVAHAVSEAALAFRSPEHSAMVAAKAAELFETSGHRGLAAEWRTRARAMVADDPHTMLQWALASASSLASQGKWRDIPASLEPATAEAPETSELLQASSLLAQAYLNMGRLAEADKWLARAVGLAASLPLPASERASHLVALADLCDLAAAVAEEVTP